MLPLLFSATTAYFTTLRLRTYLQPFQQEEYMSPRLFKWWREKRAFDRWATLGLLIAMPFGWLQPGAPLLTAILYLAYRCRQEPDPTVTAKKPLVITPRAHKIWLLAALLTVPFTVAIAVAPLAPWLRLFLTIALIQTLPLALAAANLLLTPLQLLQNRRFLREAHTILTNLHPTTIGLTGSFGKTSTKYLLNHILASHAATLATPGSVNTPLGIARVVREQLQPQHQYFLAEMGAYGPGSIAALCRLAPPALSCITAVGQAHYERFKSLEAVAEAKFEIAEATFASHGTCVLHVDAIPDALWQARVSKAPAAYRLVSNRKQILRPGDYYIESATQSAHGLNVTLQHNGETTAITAPIFGMVQVGNLAVAFALATELGLPAKTIAASLASVTPAPYRLNVQQNGTQILIDDSYNANPTGFATALETLTLLAHTNPEQARRRVLITPGMVELGTAHGPEHTRLGTLAAANADVILAIAPQRIPTFIQAVRAASHTGLHQLPTLAAARLWMESHSQPDDVILIANDLPDRYESRWTL